MRLGASPPRAVWFFALGGGDPRGRTVYRHIGAAMSRDLAGAAYRFRVAACVSRQKGYVTEAGRAVLEYARDVLGLSQLCAVVSPDNADSIRALETLGLRQHGLRELSPEAAQCCITRSIWGLPPRLLKQPGVEALIQR
ncbi:GNAT family N-acetyltransferase [Xanthomonas bromi]|uniref:GNAT family N-acetyltransferase n=1 Tax=Xanthomonas bromi TaxID=56449 RepID=UPI003CCDA349